MIFSSRQEAGALLAKKLSHNLGKNAKVVAIPRGGVVVGKALSQALNVPLTAVVVKKLGAPQNPELAIGAVCADGTTVMDKILIQRLGIPSDYLQAEISQKRAEAKVRETQLAISISNRNIGGKIAILTDDGIATGATVEAAIYYLRSRKPARIVLAVPVAPSDTIVRLRPLVDEMVIGLEVEEFEAVGQFYESFPQVEDEEVKKLLRSKSHK